jgi:hypothetical protein
MLSLFVVSEAWAFLAAKPTTPFVEAFGALAVTPSSGDMFSVFGTRWTYGKNAILGFLPGIGANHVIRRHEAITYVEEADVRLKPGADIFVQARSFSDSPLYPLISPVHSLFTQFRAVEDSAL